MPTTPPTPDTISTPPAAPTNPVDAFDWDTWIAGRARPSTVVRIHPGHDELEELITAKAAEIEQLLADADAAERTDPENRGITDASPAALTAIAERASEEYRALRARYDALAVPFHVVQLTQEQITAAHERAVADGVDPTDRESLGLHVIAAAITAPPTTAANLRALKDRDRSGAQMVTDITTAVGTLLQVNAPFSPPSSPAPS